MTEVREGLLEEIDALPVSWTLRAILFGLAETGRLTELVCQEENCCYPGVPFTYDRSSHRLVIDHKIPRREGGGDRLDNLRPIHSGCNIARAWRGVGVDVRVAARTASRKANAAPVSCVTCKDQFASQAVFLAHHHPCVGSFTCGHPNSPENRAHNKTSRSRACKTCRRQYMHEYRERKKVA